MPTIDSREYKRLEKYFMATIGGVILGTIIAIGGLAREYYQTGNIPGVYPLKGTNQAIALTGCGVMALSIGLGYIPIHRSYKARKNKRELESLTESPPDISDINPPYNP